MGLFGFGSKSNEEIIEEHWNESDPAAYDVEAIVSTLDDDDGEIRLAASKLLCAVADAHPTRLTPHVEEMRPGIEAPTDEVAANVTYALTYAIESDPSVAVGPVLAAVADNLSSPDELVRQYSLNVLWQVATHDDRSAEAVGSLHRHDMLADVVRHLSDDSDQNRLRAAIVVREACRISPDDGTEYVADLSDALDDPNEEVVTAAAAALSWVASEHRDAVQYSTEPLAAVLADCSAEHGRLAAAGALSHVVEEHPDKVAPHADALVGGATDPSEELRARCLVTLRTVGQTVPDALEPHRETFADLAENAPGDEEREHARACLDAVDAAAGASDGGSADAGTATTSGAGTVGGRTVEEVIEENAATDDPARLEAGAIAETLTADDETIKHRAGSMLVAVAEEDPDRLASHTETLTAGLDSENTETVQFVLLALKKSLDPASSDAVDALPAVVGCLSRDDDAVREFSLEIVRDVAGAHEAAPERLASLHDDGRLEAVTRHLRAEDAVLRDHAAAITLEVCQVRPAVGRTFVDDLAPLLADPNEPIVSNALATLSFAADDHPETIAHLTDDLVSILGSHSNEYTRATAAGLLASIAQESPERLVEHADAVVGAITDGTDQERQQLSFVLRFVGEVVPDALEPHRETLATIARDDTDDVVREQTRGALDALTD